MDVSIELVRQRHDEQAGLGGDRDAHLVADGETAAPLPTLLGDEDSDEVEKMTLLVGVEPVEGGHVAE